ncbi:MAG: succinate dehydrogenase/fumarate reductase iron-sulfur subunit [Planctomycetes bacterium]|nr:succinate dehydrogenase/fumarate reductase iron-sulfur subunit [Planctomycetota bacterium]
MSGKRISLTLKVWRQESAKDAGKMATYEVKDINDEMSFLEMLDVLNEQLVTKGERPITFDHDCREGICGACGFVINGHAHSKEKEITVCQLHMRKFQDGETLVLEPWRAKAFPVLQDLMVDRSAFDRIQAAGGYTSVHTGSAVDANSILIPKVDADAAFDAATCIGCGACVASCKNASAMLFVGAKVSQFALLPQGQVERERRVKAMVERMDAEGFGNCTNEYECEAACPKGISVTNIARMNREFLKAAVTDQG